MSPGFVDCPQCGHQVAEGKNFCSKCGFRIARAPVQAAPKKEDDLFQDVASQLFALEAKKVEPRQVKEEEETHYYHREAKKRLIRNTGPLRVLIYSLLAVVLVVYAWGMIIRLGSVTHRRNAEELMRSAEAAAAAEGVPLAAVPKLEDAITVDPAYPLPYFKLAEIYTQSGQNEVAWCYHHMGNAAQQQDEQDKKIHLMIFRRIKNLFKRKEENALVLTGPRACLPQDASAEPERPKSNL